MGVIQSAINSGMTTLAAGVGAGKKIGTDVKKAKLEMDALKAEKVSEVAEIQKQLPQVQENIDKQKSLVKLAKQGLDTEILDDTDYDPAKKKYFAKNTIAPLDNKAVKYNINKHKKALAAYQNELAGLKMQMDARLQFLQGGKK